MCYTLHGTPQFERYTAHHSSKAPHIKHLNTWTARRATAFHPLPRSRTRISLPSLAASHRPHSLTGLPAFRERPATRVSRLSSSDSSRFFSDRNSSASAWRAPL